MKFTLVLAVAAITGASAFAPAPAGRVSTVVNNEPEKWVLSWAKSTMKCTGVFPKLVRELPNGISFFVRPRINEWDDSVEYHWFFLTLYPLIWFISIFYYRGAGGMADTRNPDAKDDDDPRKSISAAPSFEEYLKARAAEGN